jgi:hypothetical protein
MKTFYVSLVNDLIGIYLKYEAPDEDVVREYLARHYRTQDGVWKLPWCSIYTKLPDDHLYVKNGGKIYG